MREIQDGGGKPELRRVPNGGWDGSRRKCKHRDHRHSVGLREPMDAGTRGHDPSEKGWLRSGVSDNEILNRRPDFARDGIFRVDRFILHRGVDQRARCRGGDLGGNPMVGRQFP